jgi:hypothetical protein
VAAGSLGLVLEGSLLVHHRVGSLGCCRSNLSCEKAGVALQLGNRAVREAEKQADVEPAQVASMELSKRYSKEEAAFGGAGTSAISFPTVNSRANEPMPVGLLPQERSWFRILRLDGVRGEACRGILRKASSLLAYCTSLFCR